MQKSTLLMLLCLAGTVPAQAATSENPHQEFSTAHNHAEVSTITWQAVKNVQAECERQSKLRRLGGFGYAVEACAFWDSSRYGNRCHIITAIKVNFHTLGHEVRHCFQGAFHK